MNKNEYEWTSCDMVLGRKHAFVKKVLMSISTAAGCWKEQALWALLTNKELSSSGGGKGAGFLGQEDPNFIFIAAMRLQADRRANKACPLKSQEICYFFQLFNPSCQPFAIAPGDLLGSQTRCLRQRRTAQEWHFAPKSLFPLKINKSLYSSSLSPE